MTFLLRDEPSLVWAPPTSAPKGRWYALVCDTAAPLPWTYCTRAFEGGTWEPLTEAEMIELRRFVKTLAHELPGRLCLDRPVNATEQLYTTCDVRLLNFSSARFDRPEVVRGLCSFADATRRTIVESVERSGLIRAFPTFHYSFEYQTIDGATFGVCWYQWVGYLHRPDDGTLRPVPDAAQLRQTLNAFREAAAASLPAIPVLDPETLPPPPAGTRGRPAAQRLLDASSLNHMFAGLDAVLEPAHDALIAAFQEWLEMAAGQACPLHEDNKRFATMVLERIDLYGVRLFLERKGELVQVRVDARPAYAAIKSNPDSPTAKAGLFSVRTYAQGAGGSVQLGEMSTFPELIAARDLAHAKRIQEERKQRATPEPALATGAQDA